MTLQEAVEQFGQWRGTAHRTSWGGVLADYEVWIPGSICIEPEPQYGDSALWQGEKIVLMSRFNRADDYQLVGNVLETPY